MAVICNTKACLWLFGQIVKYFTKIMDLGGGQHCTAVAFALLTEPAWV